MSELPGDSADFGASDVPSLPADAVPCGDAGWARCVALFDGSDFGDLGQALADYRSSFDRTAVSLAKLETMVSRDLRIEPDMSPWGYVSSALAGSVSIGLFHLNQPGVAQFFAQRGFRSMTRALCFAEDFDRAQRLVRAIDIATTRKSCVLMVGRSMARAGRLEDAVELVTTNDDKPDPQDLVVLGVHAAIGAGDPSAIHAMTGVHDSLEVRRIEASIVRAVVDDEVRTNSISDMPNFRYVTDEMAAILSHWRRCRWSGTAASRDLLQQVVYSEPIMSELRHPLLQEFGVGAGLARNEELTQAVMELVHDDDLFVYLRGYQLGLARSLSRIARLKSAESAQ